MATKHSKDKLPFGLIKSDLEYPKWREKDTKAQREAKYIVDNGHLSLVYTERFGWCVRTLHISNARRGAGAWGARSYGINEDKQLVSIGAGPHVLREIQVHVTKARSKELKPLLDLYLEGMAKAGEARDRISTRRARTSLRRGGFGLY